MWLEPAFTHDEPDDKWLAAAGTEGWIVLTRDKKIRERYSARRSVEQHGVGMFVFAQKRNLTIDEYVRLTSSLALKMERLARVTPRPFIFCIYADGSIKQMMVGATGTEALGTTP